MSLGNGGSFRHTIPMRVAIVGCGYVADYYVATLANHPDLELAGVFDRDPQRAQQFASHHGLRRYGSLDEALGEAGVQLVANLTNPRSHFEVSRAALEAGKHVYSEKPLATSLPDAAKLVELAESRGLLLGSAPCTVLGEAAQTMWRALREERIGTPRLVYAEMDDGPIPLEGYRTWRSASGAPWPAQDEFEVGCTIEHAGYCLTWLTAFFGPARSVTSYARVLMPEKGVPLAVAAPDFTVGTIEFASGVVARLTCGIFASPDRRLRVYGDAGVLTAADTWNFGSPVYLSRRTRLGLRAEKHAGLAKWVGLGPRRLPLARRPRFRWSGRPANRIDYSRGIAEVAAAAREGRPSRLSARWSLHFTELALAIQDPATYGCPRQIGSTFAPMEPMPWAS
jgi:predicted dehydrogenase